MRRLGLLFVATGLAVLLAAQPSRVKADGKASDSGPQNDQPVDTPGSGAAGGGRGIPSQTDAPRGPPPAEHVQPPSERWNSAAAAIWRHRGRVNVAIGYSGVRQTAEDARASAMDACRSAGGQGCKPIGAWNSGCLYITNGHSANRAGWGSGGSIDEALKKCRAYGFACKPPIGGCVD
jgi:hypothetical protein